MNKNFREEYIMIHQAIHDTNVNSLTINGIEYPVELHTNGCRYVEYTYLDREGNEIKVRLIAQNPAVRSHFGSMAKSGIKITWVQQDPAWFYITDDRIEEYYQSRDKLQMAI